MDLIKTLLVYMMLVVGSATEAAPAREELPVVEAATAREELDAARTAAKQLGLDITRPWPGGAEPLRRLFATQAAAEDAPEDGFTYVRAPMPRGSGYGDCLAGLKAGEGRPVAIRYALPGRYSPEPPAGMEDYIWTGAGGEGYWVLEETP